MDSSELLFEIGDTPVIANVMITVVGGRLVVMDLRGRVMIGGTEGAPLAEGGIVYNSQFLNETTRADGGK